MFTKLKLSLILVALGVSHAFAQAQAATPPPGGYSAAVFTTNRAGAEYDGQLPVLEDLLTGKLTDLGFRLMSREFVTTAASKFDGAQVADPLADQSTAVRLAQSMGADYILSASITSFSKQKRNINAYGVQLANYTYTLRLSYKVLDAAGGSLTGGVVTSTKDEQNTVYANSGFNVVPPDPSTPPAPVIAGGGNADEALMRFAKQHEKSIGVVVLTKDGRMMPFGTAWGVGPNAFATNSHITEDVIKYAAQGISAAVVINKHPEMVYKITKAVSHPRYGQAGANGGRNANGGSYDVGILEVEGQLPSWFSIAPASELQRIDSGYRVAYLGFPMDENSMAVDPRSPVATMQTGIVTSNTDWWGGVGTPDSRFLIQHNLSSTGGASGSAIFNTKGQVIALHNAGNYTRGFKIEGGQPTVSRIKSGLQIGYAQRADTLADIYNIGGGGRAAAGGAGGGGGSSSVAAAKPALVAFVDPEVEPILADLLDDATTQIAGALRAKIANNRIAAPAAKAGPVSITLKVETADLYIPDVRISDNTVSIQDGKLAVAPLNVSVEVDGVTVGSAPGKISLRPGLSKLRLTREGYLPWERTINAVEGQTLSVAMQMSPEGLKRWAELTAFMNNLKNGAKLTDAQVKVLEGQAQMLGNSGFKINTTQGITINAGRSRSLFDW